MGESAGAWSVSAHLLTNDGDNEGLFHGAIAMSGGPLRVEGPSRQQALFDDLVSRQYLRRAAAPCNSFLLAKKIQV